MTEWEKRQHEEIIAYLIGYQDNKCAICKQPISAYKCARHHPAHQTKWNKIKYPDFIHGYCNAYIVCPACCGNDNALVKTDIEAAAHERLYEAFRALAKSHEINVVLVFKDLCRIYQQLS